MAFLAQRAPMSHEGAHFSLGKLKTDNKKRLTSTPTASVRKTNAQCGLFAVRKYGYDVITPQFCYSRILEPAYSAFIRNALKLTLPPQ
ncbi:hypothetical protein KIN20_027673 [Parelaphostrongylus tenuis]|uniref:Uncharacterized protein n=1 Tax=Parelaphostrongylus tenuis TaxID=148309 RepID=A0AAD5WDZ7_PARTN|nr:hypothetical protein KIN20_027673 [Parelaphostrongylus tenuis]